MKDETITGSTDSNGLFTARLTYATNRIIPPLFCYNENNELVKGVEGLEVKGPCYQFLSEDWSSGKKIQTWVNGNDGDRPFPTYKSYSKYWNDRKFETRQVYIAVQPTEKSNKGYNETVHPLPEVSYKINIYNKPDNRTVDILQDGDKIVLTHKQAIELANEILSKINHVKTN